MVLRDGLGLAISGANAGALADYEAALRSLQCFAGDPLGAVDAALAAAPDFVIAHILKGYLYALATEREAAMVAAACAATAAALPATSRERGHCKALAALAGGHWHKASRILAELSTETPHDALALQAGHQIDFFTGRSAGLRDRIAAALPSWDAAMPGYHAILGMHAFGLEETGDYAAAEAAGRRAVALEPRDGWAHHAVAHVMEMQGRPRDGIAWLQASRRNWSEGSFLKVHNWWHLALFYYELGDSEAVLTLFDDEIFGADAATVLNLVDASAILWRLHLAGIQAAARWAALADRWEEKAAAAGHYAFNDVHAMMAFVGAGRTAAAAALLEAQAQALDGRADNVQFTREVGRPLALAVKAFGDGDYGEAVRRIGPVRALAHRFGGSHAQRDVIDLTLMEAALRGGDLATAAGLAAERCAARPRSPLAAHFASRVAAGGLD